MDSNLSHGPWYDAPSSASQTATYGHLIKLLSPLDAEPAELAARLLYRFGSIARIVQASESELRQSARSGERWVDALLVARQLVHDGMRESLIRSPITKDRKELYAYLLRTMRSLSEERIVGIFADEDGYIICEETLAEGAESHVLLTPRRVFSRALNLDARRIVLAHNHTSGCAEPSKADIEQTRRLSRQARDLGLTLDDHIVIGSQAVTSMKDRGLF